MVSRSFHLKIASCEAPECIVISIRFITSPSLQPRLQPYVPLCSHKYVTRLASSLIKGTATERNTTKEGSNSLRVLQRVLPVIFELGSEPRVFGREVLRKRDVIEVQVHRKQCPPTQISCLVILGNSLEQAAGCAV